MGGIQDRANGNAARVRVYVVKAPIKKGTYGSEAKSAAWIGEASVPREFLPANAIRSIDDDIGEKVAVNDLAVNQIVTVDMFADPASVESTFASRLEKIRGKDQTAISISVDNIRGVANLLQPGDYVNVMSTVATPPEGGSQVAVRPGDPLPDYLYLPARARMIYQKAQILAIDETPVAQPGEVQAASAEGEGEDPAAGEETANRGLLTLIVPAKAAQYIASLDPSAIYLALVPRDYEPVPVPDLEVSDDPTNPLPGEDPDQLTPYGPDGPGSDD